MVENERTIVPGTWSDVFAGLNQQGLGRLRVQLVDEDGAPVTEALPLPVFDQSAEAAVIINENRTVQILAGIYEILKKILILQEEGMGEEL